MEAVGRGRGRGHFTESRGGAWELLALGKAGGITHNSVTPAGPGAALPRETSKQLLPSTDGLFHLGG